MPKAPRHLGLGRIEVDADDLVGAGQARALNHVEADAAEPEHRHVGARPDLGGPDHRADAGGDPAADVADGLERGVSRTLATAISGSTVWLAKVEQPM